MPNMDWNIRLRADQATVQQTSSAAGMLLARLRDMQGETKRLRADSDDLSASWRTFASSAGARAALQEAKGAAKAFADELSRVEEEAKGAAKATKGIGPTGGGGPGGFQASYRAMRQENRLESFTGRGLSDILGPLGMANTGPARLAGDMFRFVDAIPQASLGIKELTSRLLTTGPITTRAVSGLQQLAPALGETGAKAVVGAVSVGALAAATVALAAAQQIAKNIIDKSAAGTKAFVDVNRRYAEVIGTGTTTEVQKAIQANEDRNKQLEIERVKLAQFVAGGEDVDGFTGRLIDVNDALNLNLGGWEDAQNRLLDVNTELKNNTDLNAQLEQGLKDGGTAAADYAERLGWVKEQVRAAGQRELADIDRRQGLRTSARQQALTADDPEALAQEMERLRIEYQESITASSELTGLYEAGLLTLDEYHAAQRKYLLDQENLIDLMNLIRDVLTPAAIAAKQAADAQALLKDIMGLAADGAEGLTGALGGVTDTLENNTEQLEKYADATAEVEADRALKTQREQEDFERDRLNDLADHYADMADLDAHYYDERQDILDSLSEDLEDVDQQRLDEIKAYNQESRRLAEDHRDEILRIQREMNRDYNEAARARDTVGALAALRQGEQQLEDEQDQYGKEQDRRQEDMAALLNDLEAERQEKIEAAQKELADLEQKHRKERTAKERAFQVQLQREDEQRRIAAQRQAEDWQREDQARRVHFGVIETSTGTHYTNLKTIAEVGMGAIQGFVSTAWSELVAGLAAASGSTTTGAVGSPTVPTEESHYGYAGGGFPPLHQRVRVGERQPETAVFASGAREIVGLRGRESAVFTEPVRIYPSARAMPSALTVNLGGLGGVQIHAGAGMSARSLAEQAGRQLDNLVVDALERIINNYAGGS